MKDWTKLEFGNFARAMENRVRWVYDGDVEVLMTDFSDQFRKNDDALQTYWL